MTDVRRSADSPGTPQGVRSIPGWLEAAFGLSIAMVVSGAALVVIEAAVGPTYGATRSARLRWEERRHDIEAVLRREGASVSAPGQTRGRAARALP